MATIIRYYSDLSTPPSSSILDFRTHRDYLHDHQVRIRSPFDGYYVRPSPSPSRCHWHRRHVPVTMRRMINRNPWASFENSCNSIFNGLQNRLLLDHSESDTQMPLASDSDSSPLPVTFDTTLLELFAGIGLPSERHHAGHRPRIQRHEDEKQWTVDIELPGIGPDDVDVVIEKDHVLHISGKTRKNLKYYSHATSSTGNNTGSQDDQPESTEPTPNKTEVGSATGTGTTNEAPDLNQDPNHQPQAQAQVISGPDSVRELPLAAESRCQFKYSYTLPEGIDQDRVHASLQNGVLRVSVPKVNVSANRHRRHIAIKTGTQATTTGSSTGTSSTTTTNTPPSSSPHTQDTTTITSTTAQGTITNPNSSTNIDDEGQSDLQAQILSS